MISGDFPSTQVDQPLTYYAGLIKARNQGALTSERARDILIAMDKCFHDHSVKKMKESQVLFLFGTPDARLVQAG